MKKGDIGDFLDAFTGQIDKENIELYKNLLEKGVVDDIETPEQFYFAILYPFSQFIDGLIQVELKGDHNVQFIMKCSRFIENNFVKLIETHEGSACSADKSRTIMKSLLNFYLKGDKIEFNYEQEYTYHLPKKIFKTHDSIIEFFEALYSLYYGNGDKYIKAMLTL